MPGSIMHYDAFAFAKDRRLPTITPKKKGAELGQRKALSKVCLLIITRQFGNFVNYYLNIVCLDWSGQVKSPVHVQL